MSAMNTTTTPATKTINYVYSPEFDKLQALEAVAKTYRGACSMGEKHDQDMLNNLRAQTKLSNAHNKTVGRCLCR